MVIWEQFALSIKRILGAKEDGIRADMMARLFCLRIFAGSHGAKHNRRRGGPKELQFHLEH